MTAALASTLPAGIAYDVMPDGPDLDWRAPEIAEFQAERLREAGYKVVLNDTDADGTRYEWAVRFGDSDGLIYRRSSEYDARTMHTISKKHGGPSALLRRAITVGEWQEVPNDARN
jgi:hypothetical protein